MKKIILGMSILTCVGMVTGCGGQTTQDTSMEQIQNQAQTQNQVQNNGETNVTKKDINEVQGKIQEIKAEVMKVQMDKTLSKEEKAQKIEVLQLEIKDYTDTRK